MGYRDGGRQMIRVWLAVPPAVLFLALFVYPGYALLSAGLGLGSQAPVLSDPYYRHVIIFTLAQALASTVLSALLGTLLAVLYSEERFPGRTALWRLSLVGFALPQVLVALLFAGLWGSFDGFYGWTGILAAHVFFNAPLFFRYVGGGLLGLDRSEELAALSLGATRKRVFREITWPKIAPAFRGAFALCFLYCASSFAIVLLLGGGPRFTTVEVAVYQAIVQEFDLALAARLATLQAVLALVLYTFLPGEARTSPPAFASVALYRLRSRRYNRLVLGGLAAILTVLVIAPIASLVTSALVARWPWRELAEASATSVKIAVVAGILSAALAFSFSYLARKTSGADRWAALVCGIPLAFSPILLSLAWRIAYPELAANWRGEWFPVALLHGIVALPVAYRPVRDGWNRVSPGIERAATSLGASPWRVLTTIELPLLRRSLLTSLSLGAAVSMGEVGAVLLFFDERLETLPLKIFREMGRYRFDEAYAAGLVLVMVIAVLSTIASRFEEKRGWR